MIKRVAFRMIFLALLDVLQWQQERLVKLKSVDPVNRVGDLVIDIQVGILRLHERLEFRNARSFDCFAGY